MHNPLQGIDYDTLHSQRLVSVRGRNTHRMSNGSTSCDALAFCLERDVLVVTVNADTDEVELARTDLEVVSNQDTWKNVVVLGEFLGKELGWCWIGRNYRGYADTLTLSFSGLDPELSLCGEGSALSIYKLQRT